jgi:hypothetical protein
MLTAPVDEEKTDNHQGGAKETQIPCWGADEILEAFLEAFWRSKIRNSLKKTN